jgi:hypothetical protein
VGTKISKFPVLFPVVTVMAFVRDEGTVKSKLGDKQMDQIIEAALFS